MHWSESLVILLGGVTALMLLGPPVGIAFLAINVIGALLFLGGTVGLEQLARNSVSSLNNFSLTPIPFFILMGEILFHTGVAMKSIDAVDRAIRRVPGRLAIVALVAGTIFSAISGSTIATTAMLGALLLPQMLERGYDRKIAMGPIMAIGGVDVLIPPSALTVLFGSLAGISISGLLVAGILPGIIMSALFIGYVVLRCTITPSLAPAFKDDGAAVTIIPLLVHLGPLFLIFSAVIGSIVGGWATPTESGALGAMATIIVAACYRSLSWESMRKAFLGTIAISGSILFILMAATTFSQILSFSGATVGLTDFVQAAGLGRHTMIIGMLSILVVLGFFIDQVSIMLITLPFFLPLIKSLNVDQIWFGILFMICMQIGLLSPPFGLLLFVMKGAAPPDTKTTDVWMAATPYMVMMAAVMVLIYLVPWFASGWYPQ